MGVIHIEDGDATGARSRRTATTRTSGRRHTAQRTGQSQVGGESRIFLHHRPARRTAEIRVGQRNNAAAAGTDILHADRRAAVRATRIGSTAATDQIIFELVDLIGLEHQTRAVTKFAQTPFAGELTDFLFGFSEGGLGLLKRVEHFGHHGADS